MTSSTFTEIYVRDLNKLKEEITLYKSESSLWKLEENISNTAGNLCLHLIGNINYFIGAQLGKTGYVRQRDLEFSDKNVQREKLIKDIDAVIIIVENTLSVMKDDDFQKSYPLEIFGKKEPSVNYVLVQFIAHFNYHLGQINYHRRLID